MGTRRCLTPAGQTPADERFRTGLTHRAAGGPKASPVRGESPVAGGALLGGQSALLPGVLAVEAYPGMSKPALAVGDLGRFGDLHNST